MRIQKKHKLFALCLVISFQLSIFNSFAQWRPNFTTHNIYLNTDVGYSSFLLKNAPDFTTNGSWGSGIGIGYELNYRAFILKFGAEGTYLNTGLNYANFTQQVDLVDDDNPGEPYTGNYSFSGNSDSYRFLNVNVPLMLGFRVRSFYFLTGGKVGLNLFAESNTATTVLSTGTYPALIDDLENMPNHSFLKREEKGIFSGKFPRNTYLSVEMGFYMNDKSYNKTKYNLEESGNKIKYRLSVFADYGLMNLREDSNNENLTLEREDVASPYRPYLNSLIRSEMMRGSVVNSLFAGLRFTVLLGFEQKQDCGCNINDL